MSTGKCSGETERAFDGSNFLTVGRGYEVKKKKKKKVKISPYFYRYNSLLYAFTFFPGHKNGTIEHGTI